VSNETLSRVGAHPDDHRRADIRLRPPAGFAHGAVRRFNGLAEDRFRARFCIGQIINDGLHGNLAGDFAAFQPAHAIGENGDRRIDVVGHRILIVDAHLAGVALRNNLDTQCLLWNRFLP
jgi:hypothetical protein